MTVAVLRALGSLVLVTGLVFLVLPTLLVIPLSFSSSDFLTFPPAGFSLRWYATFVADPRWLGAFERSVLLSATGATIASVVGMLAAWVIVAHRNLGTAAILTIAISPIVLPPIVLAIGAFVAFAKIGLYGSPIGLILVYSVLGLPYAVSLGAVAIRRLDRRLEMAARGLGAPPWRVAVHITIPRLIPTIVAAWLLAFLTAFDEVVITNFLLPRGLGNTLAMELYSELRNALTPLVAAVSGVLIGGAVILTLLGAWRFVGRPGPDPSAAEPSR
jgi:ABC-type spermidine/putrescine transport system permease subunit II